MALTATIYNVDIDLADADVLARLCGDLIAAGVHGEGERLVALEQRVAELEAKVGNSGNR